MVKEKEEGVVCGHKEEEVSSNANKDKEFISQEAKVRDCMQ